MVYLQANLFPVLYFQSCSLKTSFQSVKVGVSFDDLKKRVLCLPGPFTTVRRLVRSFSSTRRPSSHVAQEVMVQLQASGVGNVAHISKQCVFFKELPDVVNSIQVAACGVTPEEYKTAFLSPDEKLTTAQQEVIMSAHPKRQTVEDYVEKESPQTE